MDSDNRSAARRPFFRVLLIRAFQLFIVLCLIDGFVDIAYPSLRAVKDYVADRTRSPMAVARALPDPKEDYVLPRDQIRRKEPGISGIPGEYRSPLYNVAPDGLRSNGQPVPIEAKGYALLLGSSVGFGSGVADNNTIAAWLERSLGDVRVANYGGLAQTIPESVLRWQDVQTRQGRPAFVVIAGANMQLYRDCYDFPPPQEAQHQNVLLFLSRRLSSGGKTSGNQPVPICTDSRRLSMAVRSSLMAVQNAAALARKQDIPLYIVYLPTPYDQNANVQNLLKLPEFRSGLAIKRTLHARYLAELRKLGLPEVVDLSDAFPPGKMFFLDIAGHLSVEGNHIIAERLASLLRDRTKR